MRHHGRAQDHARAAGSRPVRRQFRRELADDVTYSGTIAGAIEGTLLGIRSIALSQAYNVIDQARIVPWEIAETLAPALLDKLLQIDLPSGVFLNVNFPNCPPEEVEAPVVTSQGKLVHSLWIDERADGRGFPYYWLRFGREAPEVREGSDIHAVQKQARVRHAAEARPHRPRNP